MALESQKCATLATQQRRCTPAFIKREQGFLKPCHILSVRKNFSYTVALICDPPICILSDDVGGSLQRCVRPRELAAPSQVGNEGQVCFQATRLRQRDELPEEGAGARRVQPQRRIHRFTGEIAPDADRDHQVCVPQEVWCARIAGAGTAVVEHREAQPGIAEREEGLGRHHARAGRVAVNVRRPTAIGAAQQPGDAIADRREDQIAEALRPKLIEQTGPRQRGGCTRD